VDHRQEDLNTTAMHRIKEREIPTQHDLSLATSDSILPIAKYLDPKDGETEVTSYSRKFSPLHTVRSDGGELDPNLVLIEKGIRR
jgi:hypothetical protein